MKKEVILTEEEYEELISYKKHYDNNEIKFVLGYERCISNEMHTLLKFRTDQSPCKYIPRDKLNEEVIAQFEKKLLEKQREFNELSARYKNDIAGMKKLVCIRGCIFREGYYQIGGLNE